MVRATSYSNKIMKILVTGAKGFVGKNLCAQLNNIKDGKARCYGELKISDVFEYDLDSTSEQLDNWCKEADFVFNLAGVNRPKDNDEFMKGNFGFANTLLDTLKKYHNTCPVVLVTVNMVVAKRRVKIFFYNTAKRQEPRFWSIAFRTFTVSGAVQTITVP